MATIIYEKTPGFEKKFKKLEKKWRTLSADLKTAQQNAIEIYHVEKIDNHSVFPIPGFCNENIQIFKLKKFACRSLKGRGVQSGIRIIYAFFPKDLKIVFIDIYFKADQTNEDKGLIKEFISDEFANYQ